MKNKLIITKVKRDNGMVASRKRTAKTKEIFLQAFEASMGIISNACKRSNIGRKIFYTWLKEDPVFAKAIDELKIGQLSQVEDHLLKGIKKENPGLITFYLSKKHPDYSTTKLKVESEQKELAEISNTLKEIAKNK